MPAFLSAREAAASVGVTERTIRNWISSGKLPAERTPAGFRVRAEDVPAPTLTTPSQVPEMPTWSSDLVALLASTQAELVRTTAAAAMWQARAEHLQAQLEHALPPARIDGDFTGSPPRNGTSKPDQSDRSSWWRFWAR